MANHGGVGGSQRATRSERTTEGSEPELVSKLPKLTVTMKPSTKARLEAYSTLSRQPAWRIVDEAVRQMLDAIPAEDKYAVEGMAKRIEARAASSAARKSVA